MKNLVEVILWGQVIFNISSNQFFIFLVRIMKSAKINSLKVYRVFNLSISLLMLIVHTILSFSSCYLKGTNCWWPNLSMNLFSWKILWQFYPETGNSNPQKFLIMKIFAKNPIVTMKISNKMFGMSFYQF